MTTTLTVTASPASAFTFPSSSTASISFRSVARVPRSSSPEPDLIDFDGHPVSHESESEDEGECSRTVKRTADYRSPLSATFAPSLTVTAASPRRRSFSSENRPIATVSSFTSVSRSPARSSRPAYGLLPMTPLGTSSHFHTATNRPGMSAASRTSSSDTLRKSVLRKASESPPKAQNAVSSRYPSAPPKQKLSRQIIKPQNPTVGPREFVINWSSGENRSVIGA